MRNATRRALRALGLVQLLAVLAVCWVVLAASGLSLPGSLTARRIALRVSPGLLAADPPREAAPGAWQGFTPSPAELEAAVAVLTAPDHGRAAFTTRYPGPVVRYRLELAGYPASFVDDARAALAWVATQTGLTVVETTGEAEIVVVPKADRGAWTVTSYDGGTLTHSRVELGCCRPRAAWEDLAQAFGPTGDRAGSYSVFSNTQTRVLPSAFDAWVLHWLYQLPPGAAPATVRATLEAAAGQG